jgi:hypothetical protein
MRLPRISIVSPSMTLAVPTMADPLVLDAERPGVPAYLHAGHKAERDDDQQRHTYVDAVDLPELPHAASVPAKRLPVP